MILSTFENTCRENPNLVKIEKKYKVFYIKTQVRFIVAAILKIAMTALCDEGTVWGRQDSGTDTSHCYVIRTVRCLSCSSFSMRQLQKPQQYPDTHHLCKGSNQRSRVCKTLAERPQNSLRPYSHGFPQAVSTLYCSLRTERKSDVSVSVE